MLLFSGCLAGISSYQFGSRTLFPNDIETVYVPVFESNSYRKGLAEELTEAVIKEIEKRTPYKVVGTPNADTTLTGKIVSDNKHLLFESLTGDPRESELNLKVEVTWANSRGDAIRKIPAVPVPNAAVSVSAANNLVPEVGQSVATSQQTAIQRLAQQIVNLMEAPW
jgi:hypothetical protein